MAKGLIVKTVDCTECDSTGNVLFYPDPDFGGIEPQLMTCDNCEGEGTIEVETEAWEEKFNNKD